MIPKYADAKEGQALYDSYSGFFDKKTKTASYHIETVANNIARAPSSVQVFFSSTSSIVKYTQHQKAPDGMGAQIVNFPRAGQADISLNITKYEPNTSAATNISGEVRNRIENVTFPVLIIP